MSLEDQQAIEDYQRALGSMTPEDLALKTALMSPNIERSIELEKFQLESQTRSESIVVLDREKKKVSEKFTTFKPIITRDTFLANIRNDAEFMLADLNITAAFLAQYIGSRKRKRLDVKTGRIIWEDRSINLQPNQHFDAAYKDARLGLTRSERGWFAELIRTNIASAKTNSASALDEFGRYGKGGNFLTRAFRRLAGG